MYIEVYTWGLSCRVAQSYLVCTSQCANRLSFVNTHTYIYTQLVKKLHKTGLAGSVGNQIRSTHIATGWANAPMVMSLPRRFFLSRIILLVPEDLKPNSEHKSHLVWKWFAIKQHGIFRLKPISPYTSGLSSFAHLKPQTVFFSNKKNIVSIELPSMTIAN